MKKMRMLLLFGVLLIVRVPSSAAQAGTLELFADANATSCVLAHTPFIESVFVIQTAGASTTGVGWFSAPKPACWNATWISDNYGSGGKIGDSQTAITVGLGVCRPLPAVILEIQYLAGATSTPCCQYALALVPGQTLVYTDCSFAEHPMTIGPRSVTINPDASCPCQLPVATEPSSWGRVKALYR